MKGRRNPEGHVTAATRKAARRVMAEERYLEDLHKRQVESIDQALKDLRERWAKQKNPLSQQQVVILRELKKLASRPLTGYTSRRIAALKKKLRAKQNPFPMAGIIAPATREQIDAFLASLAGTFVAHKLTKKRAAKKTVNPKARKSVGHASPKARKVYAMFHGTKPRKKTIVKTTRAKLPGRDFAKIGDLVSLTVGNRKISFDRDKTQPIVVTDAKATKLFFIGGNQNLSGMKPEKRGNPGGLHDMGEVQQIEYYSRKKFDDFAPTVYYHELGEENGIRPRLHYDPKARQMYLSGGDYKIKPEGIVN
jgi:hypothetical protein